MGLGSASLSFTAWNPREIPISAEPRWVVCGKSNVGKSSFLNALLHPFKEFRTGKEAGVTRGLVGVNVRLGKNEKSILQLVDSPGFGFSGRSSAEHVRWESLFESLKEASTFLEWIWLVDPRHEPDTVDEGILKIIGEGAMGLVFTKSDQCKKTDRLRLEKKWSPIIRYSIHAPLWVSSLKGEGFDELFKRARNFCRNVRQVE